MRPEVKELLLSEWDHFENRVKEVVAMHLTPLERQELCRLVHTCESTRPLDVMIGVMRMEPDPIYRGTLIRCLESPNADKALFAGVAFMRGRYEGGLELVFSSANALAALYEGDSLPWQLCESGCAGQLTESMQRTVLDLFVNRFGAKTPCLDAMTHPWFRLLSQIPLRDDRVAEILVRIWHEVHFWDSQERYLLLQAMGGSPHPSYARIFRKMSRSRTEDLRELADKCLQNLPEK